MSHHHPITYVANLIDEDEEEDIEDHSVDKALSISDLKWSTPDSKKPPRMPSPKMQNAHRSEHEVMKRVRVAVRCRPGDVNPAPSLDSTFGNSRGGSRRSSGGSVATDTSAVSIENRDSEGGDGDVFVSIENFKPPRGFSFDHVFGEASTQDDVYNIVAKPVVDGVLAGRNGAILAYGQTGTGKTYTMGILGRITESSHGIIPNALRQLFRAKNETSRANGCRSTWDISISFIQIYLESVQDLLATFTGGSVYKNLTIREHPTKGVVIADLEEISVATFGEAAAIINMGLESRNTAATNMNTLSSRSHTILNVTLLRTACSCDICHHFDDYETRLKFVDLAGSERSHTVNDRLDATAALQRNKESRSINVSLTTLGKVVAGLAQRDDDHHTVVHVPFRDSKLTRLLQDTLGGQYGANTSLIATVSPDVKSRRETLSTLQFASRCKKVKCAPSSKMLRRSTSVDYVSICESLQQELAQLQVARNQEKAFYERELQQLRAEREQQKKLLSKELRIVERERQAMSPRSPRSPDALSTSSMHLVEIYHTAMSFFREYEARIEEQQEILEKLLSNDLRALQVNQEPDAVAKLPLARRVETSLGLPPTSIQDELLSTSNRSMDRDPSMLSLHIRIVAQAMRLRVEDSHQLIANAIVELDRLRKKRMKMEVDLVNCSHILEYLLRSNAQLRQEILHPDQESSASNTVKASDEMSNRLDNILQQLSQGAIVDQ